MRFWFPLTGFICKCNTETLRLTSVRGLIQWIWCFDVMEARRTSIADFVCVALGLTAYLPDNWFFFKAFLFLFLNRLHKEWNCSIATRAATLAWTQKVYTNIFWMNLNWTFLILNVWFTYIGNFTRGQNISPTQISQRAQVGANRMCILYTVRNVAAFNF